MMSAFSVFSLSAARVAFATSSSSVKNTSEDTASGLRKLLSNETIFFFPVEIQYVVTKTVKMALLFSEMSALLKRFNSCFD